MTPRRFWETLSLAELVNGKHIQMNLMDPPLIQSGVCPQQTNSCSRSAAAETRQQRFSKDSARQPPTDNSAKQWSTASIKPGEKLLSPLDCLQELSRTQLTASFPMEIHTAHAEPIGEFIREGQHKPFRALACPIGPSCRFTITKTQKTDR